MLKCRTHVRSRLFSNTYSLWLTSLPPKAHARAHKRIQHPSNTESSVLAMKPNLIFRERPVSSFIGLLNYAHKAETLEGPPGSAQRSGNLFRVGWGWEERRERAVSCCRKFMSLSEKHESLSGLMEPSQSRGAKLQLVVPAPRSRNFAV